MPKVTIKCDNCNTQFEKYESKLSKHNFCCRQCYSIFHSRNTKQHICEVCGKTFKGLKQNSNRFCSRECYNISHSIKNKKRKCPTCQKIFIAKASEDKYCSVECYNKDRHMPKGENHWNWKGGISKINDRHDSTEYKDWRLKVYKKDNYKCVKCGSKEKINAHHIYSWHHYPKLRYEVSNGITLCQNCHIKIHQQYGYDSTEAMT